MAKHFYRVAPAWVAATLWMTAALLNGCAGNGKGLDANGNPQSSAPGSGPLTADFRSIQDNVFTPICTRCHSGAGAPEGLQLDQGHSYALLVGVPSAEVPGVLRVRSGDPTGSYLIQKLQGSSGIVGVQMPFGGPYLPQATIDVIKQWIANGAAAPAAPGVQAVPAQSRAASAEAGPAAALAVVATMPVDGSVMSAPLATIAIGLDRQADASFLNGAARLQNIAAEPVDVPILVAQAEGNASTVLLTPLAPLGPGSYRVTLRGGNAAALTAVSGESLPADYSFTFTLELP